MPPLYPLNLSLAADIESAAKDTHSPPPQAAGQPERFSRLMTGQKPSYIQTMIMPSKSVSQ